jgi:GR25 family glycosyltransferase involved in LPS biosynthesis
MIEVFVINLDRRQDRLNSVTERLLRAGLSFSRFSASEGAGTSSSWPLSPPTVGNWLSHSGVLLEFIASKAEYALVLEDDVVPREDAVGEMPRILAELSKFMMEFSVGVLQLGYIEHLYKPWTRHGFGQLLIQTILGSRRKVWRSPNGQKFHYCEDLFRAGMHAYLISRPAAEILAQSNQPAIFVSDEFFLHLARKNQPRGEALKFASLSRSLFSQASRSGHGGPVDSDVG